MTDQSEHKPGTRILIKSYENGGEEVEEIELDPAAGGLLEELIKQSNVNGSPEADEAEQEISNLGDLVNVHQISENIQDPLAPSADVILDSAGNPIQLVQLEELGESSSITILTSIDTTDSVEDSQVLTINSVENEDLSEREIRQGQALVQYQAFLNRLKSSEPVHSGERSRPSSKTGTSILPTSSRLKNAPALLRNSRRVQASTSAENNSSNDISKRPVKGSRKSHVGDAAPSSSKKVKLSELPNAKDFEGNQPSTSSVITGDINDDDRSGQPQVYFIYQDGEGEHIAQVINNVPHHSSILSSPPFNILYQFENSQEVTLHATNTESSTEADSSHAGAKKASKKKSSKPKKPSPPKITVRKGGSELKCMEEGCSTIAYNVVELRKHLTVEHDMIFDSDTITFESIAEFKEWREHYERERMVSFIYRGGTKKVSKVHSVTYMVCHRSGHYKPTMEDTSKRQRKMKPQGSCKIGGYCTAGIKMLKNLETGQVKMDICHTHYGHPLDSEAIPHLRVNPVLRKIILKKFEEGMKFADMVAYIHHNPDRLEGLRMVDRRAVRNIYDRWKNDNQKTANKIKDEGEQASSVNMPLADCKEKSPNEQSPELAPFSGISTIGSGHNEAPDPLSTEATSGEGTVTKSSSKLVHKRKKESSVKREESNFRDEPPPTLHAMTEEGNKLEEYLQDDSNPPLLVAVDSIIPSQASPSRKRKRRGNGKKGRKTSQSIKMDIKDCDNDNLEDSKTSADETGNATVDLHPSDTATTDKPEAPEHLEDNSAIPHNQISSEMEATIDRLHNHGESGPTILLYKRVGEINVKYGGFCRAFKEDDFCLIIQTPVQRQILQMFPKIINIQILDRTKPSGHDLKLAYLSVLDDYRESIPVAWVIANSMYGRTLNQLFKILRYHCGELPVEYIMAPRNVEVLRFWTSHFRNNKPKLLQNEYTARRELRILLNRHIPNDNVRRSAWKLIEEMMKEKHPKNLKCLREKLVKITKVYPSGPTFVKRMEREWFSRIEEWSFAFVSGARCNLLFASDSFLKLKKFIGFKGTKQLNQTMDHILKIGYDKWFLRTKRMFKGDQKFCRVVEKVQSYHTDAKNDLRNASVTNTGTDDEQKWSVEWEGNVEEVYYLKSTCSCKILCKICNICMHEYVCSCKIFEQDHVMCAHIHKVHCCRNDIALDDPEVAQDIEEASSKIEDTYPPVEIPESADGTGEISSNSVICDDGTEITFISDSHAYNITEVLQAASGLFGEQSETGVPKIVSIESTDDDRILYDGADGGSIIFKLDTE